eukprot:scaffold625_cov420-Prasinococcus_capsulatus_cf.AAC.49
MEADIPCEDVDLHYQGRSLLDVRLDKLQPRERDETFTRVLLATTLSDEADAEGKLLGPIKQLLGQIEIGADKVKDPRLTGIVAMYPSSAVVLLEATEQVLQLFLAKYNALSPLERNVKDVRVLGCTDALATRAFPTMESVRPLPSPETMEINTEDDLVNAASKINLDLLALADRARGESLPVSKLKDMNEFLLGNEELVQTLGECDELMTLEEFIDVYHVDVVESDLASERVWPIPSSDYYVM